MSANPEKPPLLRQWVIIRRNCESWVAWAETRNGARIDFIEAGYSAADVWRVIPGPAGWMEGAKPPTKLRRRHSRDGALRCEICAPLRCSKAPR